MVSTNNPLPTRLRAGLADFFPGYFALVMATGIISIAAFLLEMKPLARLLLALNVAAELERHFGARLYRTVIPRNVRLAEAPSHGVPVLHLEKASKGAQAYLALAGEMLRRHEAAAATDAAEPAVAATAGET